MTGHPIRLVAGSFGWVLLAWMLLTTTAKAQPTYTVGVPVITNYINPHYVIDSDAARNSTNYQRHLIPVRVPVTLVSTSAFDSALLSARFQLRNLTTGNLHPFQGGATAIFTTTNFFFFPAGTNTYNLATNLLPTARLDPYTNYRLEAEVRLQNGTLVGTNQSPNRRFIHFRNGYSNDAPFNIISTLNSVNLSRRWLVDTDPNATNFTANLNFSLHRYDDPVASAFTNPVLIRYEVELFGNADTNTPIALAEGLLVETNQPAMPTFLPAAGGLLERPSSNNFARTIAFRPGPGIQLDSPGQTYNIKVRLQHLEVFNPFDPVFFASQTITTPAQRYLHFNGRLDFGDVPTTILSVTNTPTVGVSVVSNNVHTTLGLPNGGASLNNHPGFTTFSGLLDIGLRPNGDAFVRAPSSIAVVPPGIDRPNLNGINFYRYNLTLDSAGAKAGGLEPILPAGLGWTTNATRRTQNGSFLFDGPHVLSPQLLPLADLVITSSSPIWVAEESKPVAVRVNRVQWRLNEGRFDFRTFSSNSVAHVRSNQYTRLLAAPVPSTQQVKPSNDMYWRTVSGVGTQLSVRAGYKGGSEMTGRFTFGAAGNWFLLAHFPYRAVTVTSNGVMDIVNDRVVSSNSFINAASVVQVSVSADCVYPSCGDTTPTNVSLAAAGQPLRFTTDGGVVRAGALTTAFPLRFGWINTLGRHAHVTDPFTNASVHIPGHFLHGQYNTILGEYPVNRRPAVILLSGADPWSGTVTERLGNLTTYWNGFADYAGMNFRAGPSNSATASGLKGESTLGGGVYGPYDLKGRSKYYARRSGVSGIHDKVGTSPEQVIINGYQFTFNNFGLAFLSNSNVDSRTEGSLYLPFPTDASNQFERLMFLCNGALDKADVKDGPQAIIASYWQAPIDVSAIEFTRDASQLCNPGNGFLALGVDAYMAHVTDSFQGKLGVFPHGNFIPKSGGPTNLDSRLITPSQVRIRGPKRSAPGASGYETYVITPTIGAFFNVVGSAPNYTFPGSTPAAPLNVGFMNLPGRVRVSFFESIPAHIQTASHRPPPNPNTPGPWNSAELFVANGTWGAPAKSYFGTGYHDPDNRGFNGTTAAQLRNYRTNSTYFVRARQDWLNGAVEFNLPVRWDFGTRSFRSVNPVKEDFLLVNVEKRLAYLSAERADVRFGIQAGLPQINLANMVINEVSDALGVAQVINDTLGAVVVQPLHEGVERLDGLLADQMQDHFERVIGPSVDLLVNQIYAHLLTRWSGTNWIGGSAPVLTNFFGGPAPVVETLVWSKLGAPQQAILRDSIGKAARALEAFIANSGLLKPGPGGVDPSAVRELARALIQALVSEIDANLAAVVGALTGGELDALIAPYLTGATPSLADLRDTCEQLGAAFASASNAVNGELGNELSALLNQALNNEFPAINDRIQVVLEGYLGTFNSVNRFNLASPSVVKQKLRRTITDELYGSAYVAGVQGALKQRLFDLNGALRNAIDSTFANINIIIRDALTSILLDLDLGFKDVLGPFSGSMASAAMTGHAHFNGDAMRQVRLDAKFQWALPEKTEFQAFMEINQYESSPDQNLCGDVGQDTAEVTIGAINVPFDFLSPDLRVDIKTKFTFDVENDGSLTPVNFVGMINKTDGKVAFEAFSIEDLAVAISFGSQENYVSAALGMKMNGYKAKGGIFFGQTCSLAPIAQWDMFVVTALGVPKPTFSGAYVYGEAHIPVSEALLGIPASCFFQVTAGMGLGIFYFVEGPTYGARGMLSVSGDALCMLSLGGQLDVAGLKQGSKFKLKGQGTVYVEIGLCPTCIEASRRVTFTTETGGGKAKGSKPSVK
ncbi:MAG TPA: hypothetical protein PKE26_01530 [Kiritimatiellia bacterium]|nr:hypothetical protein [Kiritimatiellia bacterium]HMO97771.1 hypothetical protein [Kiritimatiellia bacterium]HMP95410.1 hypothetical protein [Kiritimatiellia bacterium]